FFSSIRRHTRFSRDWSSDVCSSDLQHSLIHLVSLPIHFEVEARNPGYKIYYPIFPDQTNRFGGSSPYRSSNEYQLVCLSPRALQIGRASCRERVYRGVVA